MTSRLKRPHSALDELGDWPYPANTDIDTKAFFSFDPTPYGQLFPDLLYNTFSSSVTGGNIFGVPDVDIDTFHALLPNPEIVLDPVLAYGTLPLDMSFHTDHSGDLSSPTTHNLLDVGQVAYQSSFAPEHFQSYATLQHHNSATMTPSLQPGSRQQHRKSRSLTPLEAPSVHGRSIGSDYAIDSPYEFPHGGALTPATNQSYEIIERPPELDYHKSNSMLAHENDLMGLEINSSLQTTSRDPGPTEVYSRSPQGIHLDEINSVSGAPTLTFDAFSDPWANTNSDPWVPIPNMAPPWSEPFNLVPMPNFDFSQQHETSSSSHSHSSPVANSMSRDVSNTGEYSHDSVGRSHITSREPTDSPAPSTRPVKTRRKAAGRRTGPLDDSKKPGIKMTRKVHACWCCKMRKVTCNADKDNPCPECLRFWKHKMTGPFLNKRLCIRTSLEDLRPLFIPDFMTEHFKSQIMDSFVKDLVGENGWLRGEKTEVRLLCGFGPPLIVKGVQEFRPNGGLVQIFQWGRNNPNVPRAVPSLPMGIPQGGLEEDDELSDLEQHLDQIIADEDDLNEYAERILRTCRYSQSSRTLKAVLKWYQTWKGANDSMHSGAEVLLRNAIKVIMINSIFARRLILQDVPRQFEKFFHEPRYGPQNNIRYGKSPRLINRQVKAALWVLQQRLLSDVLRDFGRELPKSDGWPTCFAVATILAFLLEQTQEKSVGFVRLNTACEGLDRISVQNLGSNREIQEYRSVALVRVFDMIHVIMRCKSEKQTMSEGRSSTKRISSMGSNLRKVISDLKEEFIEENFQHNQQTTWRLQVVDEDKCRLVSALLELIQ